MFFFSAVVSVSMKLFLTPPTSNALYLVQVLNCPVLFSCFFFSLYSLGLESLLQIDQTQSMLSLEHPNARAVPDILESHQNVLSTFP